MGYDEFLKEIKSVGIMSNVSELLSWDQEVFMPPKAANIRAMELGTLAKVQHKMFTDGKIRELLKDINKDELDEKQKANVREIKLDLERSEKIPNDFTEEFAKLSAESLEAWKDAREKSNFSIFKPYLSRIIEMTKEYANYIDPHADPYETIFHDYEPNMSVEEVSTIFKQIKNSLVPLIEKVKKKEQFDKTILEKKIPKEKKMMNSKHLAKVIGYDFKKGRLDESTHPFTSAYGRITTRYSEGWFSAIMSTLHEAGHGMYEHNLPIEHYATPLGTARSLSVHESQSRFWENIIGRSRSFWKGQLKTLQEEFSMDTDLDTFYKLANISEPGFIRVNADELTYPMHIILRFSIEQEILRNQLKLKDIQKRWNQLMQELLGITPPTDRLGVLQDTHWAMGGLGYFPTYLLGSMISAQLWENMKKKITEIDKKIENSDFDEIRNWLYENIHRHGKLYKTKELITKATGKGPDATDFINYLTKKFGYIYEI